MKRIKTAALTVAALATLLATACGPVPVATPGARTVTQPPAIVNPVAATALPRVAVVTPGTSSAGTADATITLGDTITVVGNGVAVSGTTITISAGGTYRVSGTLPDGQIVVAAQKSDTVQLLLDGTGITSATSAPIYIKSARKATVVLADGSTNALADGASRPADTSGSDEPNAALYSAVDLSISGSGSLVVDARYNDGIASKDDLDITSGNVAVTSVSDGIRGRDSLTISGGNIAVNAGKDGLKSSNDEDPEKGGVTITGGTIQLTAQGDGIQAETAVTLGGGTIAIRSGGGSTATIAEDLSAKGIKGTTSVTIDGGTITVDAADDAVHANGSVVVRGGTLLLATADDAMHADAMLDINGGDITISRAYEGIESARITITDGRIRITSRDDGVNVADGTASAAGPGMGWLPGQGRPAANPNLQLAISGGYLVIDSETDGIDANGSVTMTGGVAIVHGPTASRDGAIDYDGTFTMNGGTLIAAGSAGMAQAPSTSSTQPSVLVNFPSSQAARTVVNIGTAAGQELLTFAPNKAFQTLVVSSPKLESGATYVVQSGGNATGTPTDGLYTDGTYSGGSQVVSFTVAGAVTTAGSGGTGPGRMGGPRR